MPITTVALIFGGRSTEHEISVISARSIAATIDRGKYRTVPVYISHTGTWYLGGIAQDILDIDLAGIMRNTSPENAAETLDRMVENAPQEPFDHNFRAAGIDVAFPVLHGSYGEDGRVQGHLETCGIPYTGCGVLASAITMDKALTKLCVADAGIAVAPSRTILSSDYFAGRDSIIGSIGSEFPFPFFVKPANLGSSVGITKVHHAGELPGALDQACTLDTKVLVEKAMSGREVEVAVLGNDDPVASVCGEIEPASDFYDYQDKYIDNKAKLFIPARIPEALQEKVRSAAIRAFRALGCRGMSRIDFFVDEKNDAIVLNEVNTIPGFTDISMYPMLMEASGIGFKVLVGRLLALALEQ